MQDGVGAVHGGLDALAREQVCGHVAAAPAEDAHLVAGGPQERYDEAAESTGAAGDQNQRCHGLLQ
ncbi:hypothetical protein GCM10023096_59440 [Nonomuraea ferruginea]